MGQGGFVATALLTGMLGSETILLTNALVNSGLLTSSGILRCTSMQIRCSVSNSERTHLSQVKRIENRRIRFQRHMSSGNFKESLKASSKISEFLNLNVENSNSLINLKQGSPEWILARKHRLTASNFGTAVGHNPWKTPDELVQEMITPTFTGNAATRWGSEKESIARNLYLLLKKANHSDALKFHISESGLHVSQDDPWMAASPDGHIHEGDQTGLLEIKCPASLKIYTRIPDYYMDQVQGCMAILGYPWCDFVVWTPSKLKVERIPFNSDYWHNTLLPGLRDFYTRRFLPAYQQHLREQAKHLQPETAEQNSVIEDWVEDPPPASNSPLSGMIAPTDRWLRTDELAGGDTLAWVQAAANGGGEGGGEGGTAMLRSCMKGLSSLNARLLSNGLRLQATSSGGLTLLEALVRQLGPPGRQSHAATPLGEVESAAREARAALVSYLAARVGDYAAAAQRRPGDVAARLVGLYTHGQALGAPELAAAAELYRAHLICLLASPTGVQERHYYPSLAAGPASMAQAHARAVLCAVGGWAWPAVATAFPAAASPAAAATNPVVATAAPAANVAPSAAVAVAPVAVPPAAAPVPPSAAAAVPFTTAETAGRRRWEQVKLNGAEAAAAAAAAGFRSRYSPLFQKCVVDVTAKLEREGRGRPEAMRMAFGVCRRSIGERRYGEHRVRRNGSDIGDVGRVAANYTALLVDFQAAEARRRARQGGGGGGGAAPAA